MREWERGWHLNQAAFRSPNGFQVFSRPLYKTKGYRWIKKNLSKYGRKIVQKPEVWWKKKIKNRAAENQADESKWSTNWIWCRKGDLVRSLLRLYIMMQTLYLVNSSVPRNSNSHSTDIKFCLYSTLQLVFLHTLSFCGRTCPFSFLCALNLVPIFKRVIRHGGDGLLWEWDASRLGCRG